MNEDVKSNTLGNDLRETKEMDERVDLSLSEPNERWIQAQIDGKQFSNRSEVLNDLIRKTRETEAIRTRLKSAERSVEERGWVPSAFDAMLPALVMMSPAFIAMSMSLDSIAAVLAAMSMSLDSIAMVLAAMAS